MTDANEKELDEEFIPQDILEAAEMAVKKSIPSKSQQIYENTYNKFITWRTEKKVISFDERVFLAYFKQMSDEKKSSSLWAYYSMLSTMIRTNHDIDISSYSKLRAFIKQTHKSHLPKKANTLEPDQIDKFIREAPDNIYISTKVALIFGLLGACRRLELYKIEMKDITMKDSLILVKIPDTKNYKPKSFVVEGDYFEIVKRYINLRPAVAQNPSSKFFLTVRNGKCINSPIGINMIGNMPKDIAKYLGLENPNLYTGHSFRRTSATILADSGSDILDLKRHGMWKSTACAEGYIQDSIQRKKATANQITNFIKRKMTDENVGVNSDNSDLIKDANSNPTMPKVLRLVDANSIQIPDVSDSSMIQCTNAPEPITVSSNKSISTINSKPELPTFTGADSVFISEESLNSIDQFTNETKSIVIPFEENSNDNLEQDSNINTNQDNASTNLKIGNLNIGRCDVQ